MKYFFIIIKWWLFWWFIIPYRILNKNKTNSSNDGSTFDSVVGAYVAASKTRKALSPPTIIILNESEGYFIQSLQPVGLTNFRLKIGKKNNNGNISSLGQTTFNKNRRSGNIGPATYKVIWS